MKLKVRDIKDILKAEGLYKTPRKVGNPRQWNVLDWRQYKDFIINTTGRAICFTSHNHYPELDQLGDPVQVEIRNIFTDFDAEEKIENAQRDMLRAIDFSEDIKNPYFDNFSGRKGFHHYLRLKPKRYYLNDELTEKVRALHNWLAVKGMKVKTMDERCKDVKRLCRIPTCRYVTIKNKKRRQPMEYIVKDTYCWPIPPDLLEADISEIIEFAKAPTVYVPKVGKPKYDLDQLISKLGFDVQEWAMKNQEETRNGKKQVVAAFNRIPKNAFIGRAMEEIGRACIYNDLFSRNPTHEARRIAVILLRRSGYTFVEVIGWFDRLSQVCSWVDRGFRDVRVYQIRHIFFRYPPYHPDSCSKIKFVHGLCPLKDCRECTYPTGDCKPIKELVKC